MLPKTKYFQVCRAVFQGGGCKGAGHIGAFDAAVKCGINFSAVAGTSAGSIIAALIGAGATPEYLLKKCANLQFAELLDKPKNRIAPIVGRRAINQLLTLPARFMGRDLAIIRKIFLINGAAYSSGRIQVWIDSLLAELLPDAAPPIRFRDLILPTSIVAGDLSGKRYRLWTTDNDPEASVSMAVRSSCSIPLFFEPVESGNDFLVDGGILSNLPAFVFADGSASLGMGGRVLAFRLEGDTASPTEWNLRWLARRLVETMISGATELQTQLQPNVSTIRINTGDISSTDFTISKKDVGFLLSEGRKAVNRFVENEYNELGVTLGADVTRHGEDELFDDLVREMQIVGNRLVVSCTDTKWFWRLFPSVLYWLVNGGSVSIVTRSVAGTAKEALKEQQRRDYLTALGAEIVCQDAVGVNCFLICRNDDRHEAAFVRDTSSSTHAPFGFAYIGISHRIVIGLLKDSLLPLFVASAEKPKLRLVQAEAGPLIASLKSGVHQYAEHGVTIQQKDITLTGERNVLPKMIVRRVRSFKFRQVGFLAQLYEQERLPLYVPVEVQADEKKVTVITPPVLEQWNGSMIAVEGNTRLFHSLRSNVDKLSCFVVQGVSAPLPGRPVEPRAALLSSTDLESSERIDGFNYTNFRSIERAIRPLAV